MFRPEAHRIRLQRLHGAVRPSDPVLVARAVADAGQERLPHAGRAADAHQVTSTVPAVEVADDRHPSRVRRPDGEMGPPRAFVVDHVGAQHVPQPLVRALADEILVHLSQHGTEAVGIVVIPLPPRRLSAQEVGRALRDQPREDARCADRLERMGHLILDHEHRLGGRIEGGDAHLAAVVVRPEDGEGIVRRAVGDPVGSRGVRCWHVGPGLSCPYCHLAPKGSRPASGSFRRQRVRRACGPHVPDVGHVAADRPVGREPARPGGVPRGHARPGARVVI